MIYCWASGFPQFVEVSLCKDESTGLNLVLLNIRETIARFQILFQTQEFRTAKPEQKPRLCIANATTGVETCNRDKCHIKLSGSIFRGLGRGWILCLAFNGTGEPLIFKRHSIIRFLCFNLILLLHGEDFFVCGEGLGLAVWGGGLGLAVCGGDYC